MSFAPEGLPVTAHESDTDPAKPLLGVIVMVEVAELPALMFETGLPLRAKVGLDGGGGGVADCVLYVQVRIFWLADSPPLPPVKPT